LEKLDTEPGNPLENTKHQESKQNFRIRENMRAGFGICFKENQHIDQGPAYAEILRRNGEEPRKITLDEYR